MLSGGQGGGQITCEYLPPIIQGGQLDCLSVGETWDVPFTWPGAKKQNHQSRGKRDTALLWECDGLPRAPLCHLHSPIKEKSDLPRGSGLEQVVQSISPNDMLSVNRLYFVSIVLLVGWNLHMPGVEMYTFSVNVVLMACTNLHIPHGKNWHLYIACFLGEFGVNLNTKCYVSLHNFN